MDEPHCHLPGYRDREDSRFYQARGLSPEQTWQALSRELARVLIEARTAFWRQPLQIDIERIRWWHGAIFARRFPHDGGRFRKDRAFFGVMAPRPRGGLPGVQRCRRPTRHPDYGSTRPHPSGGALYAGILRVHPFADGNHRTAFVALSTALWSLGMPVVEFVEDADMIDHDDALMPALLSRDGEIEPLRTPAAGAHRTRQRPETMKA